MDYSVVISKNVAILCRVLISGSVFPHSQFETACLDTWCEKNEINAKTYYYRLRKIREQLCNSSTQNNAPTQAIIPVTQAVLGGAAIVIEADGIKVSIPDTASAETVAAVIRAMKC